MGVVYAAADPRLGRSVALKFVPEDLAKDHQALGRLRSEARTASGLNHPNICTIYDIDEHEGRPFIVMELLKGQTLRDHLAPGHLKIHEVVDIGIQVADALDWAHHQGVIHRDIKPANLFLIGRGQIKILDFGLAKLQPRQSASSSAAPTTDPTAAGITLGTVAYMSPEQVTGEELDGRTDIFSFGVVLYECVTGRQPFTGKTSAVVLSAILNKAPVAPVVFNSELPLRLQEVINNCLEKDRELRYPDAAGLRADLKRIKRDLESGHSGVLRAAGSLPLEADSLTSLSRSSLPLKGTANTDSSRSRAQTTDGPGVRRRSFSSAVGIMVVIALALTTTATYFVWLRPRTSSSVTIDSPSGALIQSRLELAATSLSAKSYRAALAYSEDVLQSAPGRPEAIRIRDQARTMIARFDQAIAKANALLAAGGAEDAAEVLDTARAIDPAAPAVTELSARLVNHFKSQAEALRRGSQAPRPAPSPLASRQGQASSDAARRDALPQSALPEQVSAPQPPPPQTPVLVVSAPSVAPPNTSTPPAAAPPPTSDATPATAAAPLAPREPAPRASEPAPPPNAAVAGRDASVPAAQANEDEESAIRRIVATYARAIETKDLALLRSIKPNLSPQEQRRIEAGFRAVSSQRVSVEIVSIERRGQGASVRLRRRDAIDGGGRQQTTESQQTMTLTRTGGGWFISEIGR